MPILRFIALIALVFTVMPLDQAQREGVWKKSQELAVWTVTTCQRSPETCERASEVWDNVKNNSKRTVAVIDEIVRDYAYGTTGSIANKSSYTRTNHAALTFETGSLLPTDLAPKWRGTLPLDE